MKSGDELALDAMKKDLKRLCRRATRAKAEADENINAGTEIIAVHRAFEEIVQAGDHSRQTMEKLNKLKAREARARKALGKNLLSLIDKQCEAEAERDRLKEEIHFMEWRLRMDRGAV